MLVAVLMAVVLSKEKEDEREVGSGKAGRGAAVAADEMRCLSEKIADTAREVDATLADGIRASVEIVSRLGKAPLADTGAPHK